LLNIFVLSYYEFILLQAPSILLPYFTIASKVKEGPRVANPGGITGFFSDIFLPSVPLPWGRLSP